MKLYYWQTKNHTNFGDELNPWLWDRLLPGFFDDDGSLVFLGIGSILYDSFPQGVRKIVFGSGYAGYSAAPQLDESWTIKFVRGPRSAAALGIGREFAIGDPAILVAWVLKDSEAVPKSGRGAYMPHWESAIDGDWEAVSKAAGLDFIDSRWPVDRVLEKIRAAEFLVTEAMHGAIVADALRVPWVPYAPLPNHQLKWFDWADSVGVMFVFARTAPTTWLEVAVRACGYSERAIWRVRLLRPFRKVGSFLFKSEAVAALNRAAASRRYLSSDVAIDSVIQQLLSKVEGIRSEFEHAKT